MIVVLGSINIDIRYEVEELPSAGETIHSLCWSRFAGGKGANQALAAKRAGANVAFFGAAGKDNLAQEALLELREAGVSLSDVVFFSEATGLANIYVDRQGENFIVVTAGANNLVDAKMAEAAVNRADSGFLVLQQEIPVDTTMTALKLARSRGVRTILNVSPFDIISHTFSLLADITIANENEWLRLAEGSEVAASMQTWSKENQKTLVVTKGARGVCVASPSEFFEVAAPSIHAIDTVGAGDTFCGYFAAALDAGQSYQEAARVAVVAASLACREAGTQISIPSREQVRLAMQ